MDDDLQLLRRDLDIFHRMSMEAEEFLKSDLERWPMASGDMPQLTLGGLLMRRRRLGLLQARLDKGEQERFGAAVERVRLLLGSQVVRFELKGHRELHQRLGEWIGHLRNWTKIGGVKAENYAEAADIRVVISEVVSRLQRKPYQIDPRVLSELAQVDRRLQASWSPSSFVWPQLWQPAYDEQSFWWLYGQPKFREDDHSMFGRFQPPTFNPPVPRT